MSGTPVFSYATLVFVAVIERHPLISWLWWIAGFIFLGPTMIRDRVLGRLWPQGTTQTEDWNTLQAFPWKRPTCWSWTFGLMCRLQVWHTSGGYKATLRECRLEDTISEVCFCLTTAHHYVQERSLHTHLEPKFLQLLPMGNEIYSRDTRIAQQPQIK